MFESILFAMFESIKSSITTFSSFTIAINSVSFTELTLTLFLKFSSFTFNALSKSSKTFTICKRISLFPYFNKLDVSSSFLLR